MMLPCGHTMCSECLQGLHTPVPGYRQCGLDGCYQLVKIESLCVDFSTVQQVISRNALLDDSRFFDRLGVRRLQTCPQHPSRKLIFRCIDDDSFICAECVTVNSEHHGHSFESLGQFAERESKVNAEMFANQNKVGLHLGDMRIAVERYLKDQLIMNIQEIFFYQKRNLEKLRKQMKEQIQEIDETSAVQHVFGGSVQKFVQQFRRAVDQKSHAEVIQSLDSNSFDVFKSSLINDIGKFRVDDNFLSFTSPMLTSPSLRFVLDDFVLNKRLVDALHSSRMERSTFNQPWLVILHDNYSDYNLDQDHDEKANYKQQTSDNSSTKKQRDDEDQTIEPVKHISESSHSIISEERKPHELLSSTITVDDPSTLNEMADVLEDIDESDLHESKWEG
jgi:hypothetical protein